jgi:hypothetical protein
MFESLASGFAFRRSLSLNMRVPLLLSLAATTCLELFACAPCRNISEDEIGVIKSAGNICLALLLLAVGVRAQEHRYLAPNSDRVSSVAASASPTSRRPSRFTSLKEAAAEAERLTETEEGKLYEFDFNAVMSNRLTMLSTSARKIPSR